MERYAGLDACLELISFVAQLRQCHCLLIRVKLAEQACLNMEGLLTIRTGASMAIDVYLQIDGIKGESQDDKHKDWIECTSVHWGLVQPKSATASTGGGHTAERVELRDISFSKMADLASPILMQTCAMGKTIPKVKFEFMRADGQGVPIKYFEIELESVLIGEIHPAIDPGSFLSEHVGLKFSKVKWKYTQQKITGGLGGSTVGGWDLAANKVA